MGVDNNKNRFGPLQDQVKAIKRIVGDRNDGFTDHSGFTDNQDRENLQVAIWYEDVQGLGAWEGQGFAKLVESFKETGKLPFVGLQYLSGLVYLVLEKFCPRPKDS